MARQITFNDILAVGNQLGDRNLREELGANYGSRLTLERRRLSARRELSLERREPINFEGRHEVPIRRERLEEKEPWQNSKYGRIFEATERLLKNEFYEPNKRTIVKKVEEVFLPGVEMDFYDVKTKHHVRAHPHSVESHHNPKTGRKTHVAKAHHEGHEIARIISAEQAHALHQAGIPHHERSHEAKHKKAHHKKEHGASVFFP